MLTREQLSEYVQDEEWLEILWIYLEKNGDDLFKKIAERKKKGKIIYPPSEFCFRAFNETPFDKLRVVILGQDPYHSAKLADGLAFSSGNPNVCPPSLKNILKEVEADVYDNFNLERISNYSLKSWAEQGVLLLNTALTVEEGEPGSHLNIWQGFTERIIKEINYAKPGTIFLLWGNHAKSYSKFINKNTMHILECAHPSPMSANQGKWFGNKHFSKTNEILISQNGEEAAIKW